MQFRKIQGNSDQELFLRLQSGDDVAFEAIYKRYVSLLYRAAYGVLKDRELCEDVLQELFATLWLKRNELHVRDLKAYLFTAVRNNVLMVIRSGKIHVYIDELKELVVADGSPEPMAERELKETIDRSVSRLPEKCREIFTLSRDEQLSHKEIAKQLNISVKTVEAQMTIALRRLRSSLQEYLPFLLPVLILSML